MFNAEKFLIDYDIKHFTEGKNVQEGWSILNARFVVISRTMEVLTLLKHTIIVGDVIGIVCKKS